MRRFGESESKYLKGSDLQKPDGSYHSVTVTIDHIQVDTLEREDRDPDERYVMFFRGKNKGMVLNVTNEEILIELYGTPADNSPVGLSQHFEGKQVSLYFDPTVKFAGKRVGGLRLRGPSGQDSNAEAPLPTSLAEAQAMDQEPPPPDMDEEPLF